MLFYFKKATEVNILMCSQTIDDQIKVLLNQDAQREEKSLALPHNVLQPVST